MGDLSLDLSVAGESDHPALAGAMDRVLGICRALGKVPDCAVFDPVAGRRRIAQGYRFIQYSWDVGLFGGALRSGLDQLRA